MGFIATSESETQLLSKRLECGYTTIKAYPKNYSITRYQLTVQKPFMRLGSLDLLRDFVREVNYSQTLHLIPQTLGEGEICLRLTISSETSFLTKLTTTTLECFQSNKFSFGLQDINLP